MAGNNSNVDTRVVELKFENREFERNIAQSQKSIEDLKEAMDFEETSRGLSRFSDAFDFSNIENNIQRLTDKFTGLGNVGEYVISRVRSTIESAAQTIEYYVKDLSFGQISTGQSKYDELNKSVMTIVSGGKATEEEAYGIMERVMEYTNQTSHNFSTMVGQISNLTSVGVGLEESEKIIEGIGNAATFAGQNAQSAANSMYVLSKSFSMGHLGYEQFLSLSNTAHVITDKWRQQAIEAGEAVGTLKRKNDKLYVNVKGSKAEEVTAQNLENTLHSKWLTTEVLKKIYENYQFGDTIEDLKHPEDAVDSFGKTAYLTGQRALSLADAWNAVKESVSGGWMESFRLIFGDVSEAAENFTNICNRIIDFIDKIKTFRNDLLKSFADRGGRTAISELLLGDYEQDIEDGTVGILDLLEGASSIISKGFWDFIKILNPAMMLDPNYSDAAWEENYQYRIDTLSDMFLQGVERIQNFFNETKKFFTEEIVVGGRATNRLEMISEIVSGISAALGFAYSIATEAFDFLNGIGQDLDPSITAILDLLSRLGLAIFDTAQDTEKAGKVNQFFTNLRTNLEPITSGINKVITSFTRLISIIFGLDDEDKDRSGTFDSLGKVLLTLADIIAKVIGPILDFVSKVIDAFSVFEGGFNKETIQEFGRQIGVALKDMVKAIADNLPKELSFLHDFIYDLFGLWDDEKKIEERSKTFGTFLRTLFTSGFDSISEFLSGLFGGFNLTNLLKGNLGIGSAFNFLQTIAGAFKNTNLYAILLGFLGVATVGKLYSLIKAAKRAVQTVEMFFDDVGGNLAHGFTGEYEWFGDRILKIAKAIAILAGCVVVLGSMDTSNLIKGCAALAIIIGLLLLLFYLLSPDTAGTDVGIRSGDIAKQGMIELLIITMTAAIVAICAALSVLMLAMVPLASDPKKMATAVIGLAAILTIFGVFFKLILDKMDKFTFGLGSTNQWSGLGKMALMIIALSAGVALLAVAVGALMIAMLPMALVSWEGMFRAIIAVGLILTMLGVFIKVMLTSMDDFAFNLGGKTNMKSIARMAALMLVLSGSVILLSAGIGLLILAITPLALMSTEMVARAIVGLALIMTELAVFIKVLQKLSTGDKTLSVKIAGLAAFALSLGLLVMALVPLAMMSWGGWGRALIGLGVVLAELVGFMWLVKKADVHVGSLFGFAAFAASIGILMLALTPIAGMDWGAWGRAMIGLGVVLLELIGFMWLVKKADVGGIALAGFIGFALSIAILMYSLKFVGELDDQAYVRGLVGLGTIMVMIIVLLSILKEIQPDINTAGSTLLLLAGLAVAMILFSIAFNEVKNVPWETMVAFAGAISVILLAVATAGKMAKGLSIKGILMLALGLAAILAVIALMAPLVISGIATGLAEAAGQLSLMATLMQGFTGKMDGVNEDAMDKAKRIVNKMSELLGIMIQFYFAGGAFVGFTSAVSQLKLSGGMLKDMTDRFDGITEESISHIEVIITKLDEVMSQHLSGFNGYIQSAKNFSSVMYELGTGIEIFSNHTSELTIDPDNNPAIKVIQALAECADDLDIIAKMNIDDLTAKISGLGGAMILYAEGAEAATSMGLGEGTPDVTAAISLMKSITQGLVSEGGLVIPENMPDEEAIGLFGSQLAALAAALIKFEEAGQGLGEGTDKALETLTFFKELKDKLVASDFQANLAAIDMFGSGEEAQAKAGELETFGKNIEQLGLSLGKFANSTTYIDEQTGEVKSIDYSNATKALEEIASVGNNLPSFGGALEKLTGVKEDLTTFAGEIEALGQALDDFHTNTTTMDKVNKNPIPIDYTNATTALNDIANVYKSLPNVGGVAALFEGDPPSLTKLSGDIIAVGAGLEEFGKSITGDGTAEHPGFDPSTVDPAIEAVNKMVELLSSLSVSLPKVGGLFGIVKTAFEGRDMNLSDIGSQIAGLGDGLGEFGRKIKGKFKNPEEVKTAIDTAQSIIEMVTWLTSSAKSLYSGDFAYLSEGLDKLFNALFYGFTDVNGNLESVPVLDNIISMVKYISDEMNKLGDLNMDGINAFNIITEALNHLAAIDYTKDADFINVGISIATGVKKGIDEGTNLVVTAAQEMAKAAYDAAMKQLDANSPSKVFTDVGSYIGLGMAIGIDKTSDGVVDSATGMTEKTIETARTMAATISKIMAEEPDVNPTISPVLDLTNLESGAASINGLFGGTGLTLNGGRLTISGDTASGDASAPKDYTDSINRVDSEISNLREDIQTLATAMSNIKLVMNTGAVVGAIGPDMDLYLGQKGFYSARTKV